MENGLADTSVLHLYETLGWFRRKEYIKLHFAETWNELHHLLIMEALGGNDRFSDRWVAQHIAFFYYWLVVILYMTAPAVAYDMMSKIEAHAYNTYDEFLKSHEEELKSLPAPQVAIDYYEKGNLFLFDAFQNNVFDAEMSGSRVDSTETRRPVISNLYDVFFNIRADEGEHSATMGRLQKDVCARKARGESPL
jgi:ubiquinol oxidase